MVKGLGYVPVVFYVGAFFFEYPEDNNTFQGTDITDMEKDHLPNYLVKL